LQNNRTVSNPSEPASPLAQGGSEACGLSFRDLVENINDVIFSLDVEGRIEYVSPAVERFTRYHPGEVTGQPFSRYVLPEDVEGLMANFQHALQGVLNPSEFRMVTKDGELRHMRTSSRLRLEDGKVAGLTGVMTDITERVQGEVALKEARENLERRAEERARELLESNLSLQGEVAERRRAERAQGALYRISEATHVLQDLPSLLQQIHQILGELLPVLSFYVALYDQATDELTFPYYVDEFHGPPDSRKLSDGLTDRVIRTGEPLLLSRETHEAFLEKEKIPVQRMPVLDWLGVPLVAQKRTIGALMVQSYDPKVRYTESDKALLQFVSDQIATAIERTRSEQALRLSEQRFQRVAESTGEWIWEIDREGVYTYSNGVVEAMLGYRPEEIVGRLRPQDLFVPQERETLVRVVSELLAKQQPFTGFVNTLVHKDGRRVILETRGVPVFDEGGTLTGYRGTKTNITDRVQAERKRYNLERKIQEAQRLESLGLLAGGIAHDFNNILNAILGYLELSSQDLPEDSPVQNRLERAGKACQAADACLFGPRALPGQAPGFERGADGDRPDAGGLRIQEGHPACAVGPELALHQGGYLPASAGDHEFGGQRLRGPGDAERHHHPAHGPGARRPGIPLGRAHGGRIIGRGLRLPRGDRHGLRHGAGDPLPDLRSLLHHQVHGPRIGAGGGARHRARSSRRRAGAEPTRGGQHLHHPVPGPGIRASQAHGGTRVQHLAGQRQGAVGG